MNIKHENDMQDLKEKLIEARDLISSGWARESLALTAQGKPCNQLGFYQYTYDKNGEVISSDFMRAVKWSLVGALMKVSGCNITPNDIFADLINIIKPFVKAKGFNYLADFNDHQVIVRRKIVEQTTQEDVINLIDEVILSITK